MLLNLPFISSGVHPVRGAKKLRGTSALGTSSCGKKCFWFFCMLDLWRLDAICVLSAVEDGNASINHCISEFKYSHRIYALG